MEKPQIHWLELDSNQIFFPKIKYDLQLIKTVIYAAIFTFSVFDAILSASLCMPL